MKFVMLISIKKYREVQLFLCSDKPKTLFSLLIDIEMPTIVDLSGARTIFITSGPIFRGTEGVVGKDC